MLHERPDAVQKWRMGLDRFKKGSYSLLSNCLFQIQEYDTNIICEVSVQLVPLKSAAMDGENVESLSGQPLPGATIPLDSNGAHSGDSEVKKRARTSSPDGEAAAGAAKRQKGVAPIKAESVAIWYIPHHGC
jgi:hypothetical protein